MAITVWLTSERPREKLLELGVEALSDAELLAIFAAQLSELTLVHGKGISKYVQLQAIFEMSRRALNEQLQVKDILNSLKQVRDYLCLKLGNLTREVFLVLFLDAQNKVVTTEEMFSGTHTSRHLSARSSKTCLALVDVLVLGHFTVAGITTLSFAERGL